MIIYFDTETTGLNPGQICQLSYIMESKNHLRGKNFFFTVDYVEMSAFMVHGFSVEKLESLSGGMRFSDSINEIKKDFMSADLVIAHNISFDNGFMRTEFERAGECYNPKCCFCSMKTAVPVTKLPRSSGVGYKYPKLVELCEYSRVNNWEILMNAQSLFGDNKLSFHDARFDTTALYMACKNLREKEQAFFAINNYL